MGPRLDDAHRFAPAGPDEEYVYGACCPGWHSAGDHRTAVEQWTSFMKDHGVERVCCLLTGRQLHENDANIGLYRDAFGVENVRHAPVPDQHLADVETLRQDVLPFLSESRERDQPVVVHCLAGIGRTGHVLAAWLVWEHEYDPHDAIDTVQELGRDPTEAVRQDNATRQDLLDLLGLLA